MNRHSNQLTHRDFFQRNKQLALPANERFPQKNPVRELNPSPPAVDTDVGLLNFALRRPYKKKHWAVMAHCHSNYIAGLGQSFSPSFSQTPKTVLSRKRHSGHQRHLDLFRMAVERGRNLKAESRCIPSFSLFFGQCNDLETHSESKRNLEMGSHHQSLYFHPGAHVERGPSLPQANGLGGADQSGDSAGVKATGWCSPAYHFSANTLLTFVPITQMSLSQ